ncbi:hypothetical protein FACS189421_04230 [Bacteroidia bacterium]|nr:hypothetical protein FACS189421_04230 [Bacteroidia bacterium]GHT48078.1 hypothetical protein FACS189440_10730 [Bacteroidia bacterium]
MKKLHGTGFEINDIYAGKILSDLVIVGSSRAEVQFSPAIIDSVLNVNSYNIGQSATDYTGQIGLYNIYKERNGKPEYIIHQVDDLFGKKSCLYDLASYFPYLTDTVVSNLTKQYDDLHWLDYHNPITKYWQQKVIFSGWTEVLTNRAVFDTIKYKGYYGSESEWDDSFVRYKKKYPDGVIIEMNEEIISEMREYISKAEQDSIKIALVFAPQYIEYQQMVLNRQDVIDFWSNLAKETDVLFLDYTPDSISYDKQYFYNSQHMNKKGAELFSRKLAEDLKKYNFVP